MEWTDEYQDIVGFYYWEPQHIGRASGVKRFSGDAEMLAHINRLEVSLNHILNIFFSIFDIRKLDCFDGNDSYTLLSAVTLGRHEKEQGKITQPDMFFGGDFSSLAIELKLKSKSTLSQVQKYINFNKTVYGDEIPLHLYYLTPESDISRIFKERYQTVDDIYAALDYPSCFSLRFITFSDLYKALFRIESSCETERRLVAGLIRYLDQRDDLFIQSKTN